MFWAEKFIQHCWGLVRLFTIVFQWFLLLTGRTAEIAYHNLFAPQLFLRPSAIELAAHQTDFTVIALPGLQGDPEDDDLNSEAFIVLNLAKKIVLIGGTRYAGEIKKSVFSMMNYLMTKQGVLPMHGAANIDKHGHTALFFGLSGTGKTTLSADPKRSLIGDDEHGWSEDGIFNFEGGCYAKTIRLSAEYEPQIWAAIQFGTILENGHFAKVLVADAENRCQQFFEQSLIPRGDGQGVEFYSQECWFLSSIC